MKAVYIGDSLMISFKQVDNPFGKGAISISAIGSKGEDLELPNQAHKDFVIIGELYDISTCCSLAEASRSA
jgi:hypothetical protein